MLGKASPSNTSNNIENYLKAVKAIGATAFSIDPIKYWLNSEPSFECLRKYALNLMVVPATTGPLERCFATRGSKNQTSEKVLNEKLVVHLNKKYA
uniref:HAT C-terminal dimerisation domain-containing protein n=1 Tax=Panagrolaimus sp. ES5 TaxID=591445 RepID=A0AC34GKD6_9BILA